MSYDLEVTAEREIKYKDPKTQKWVHDIQRYTLHTPDFRSEDNIRVVESDNPYQTYCTLVEQYWGSGNTIDYLNQQIQEATDKGYTIKWYGG